MLTPPSLHEEPVKHLCAASDVELLGTGFHDHRRRLVLCPLPATICHGISPPIYLGP